MGFRWLFIKSHLHKFKDKQEDTTRVTDQFNSRNEFMPPVILSLLVITVLSFMALVTAFVVYLIFFYLVIIDNFSFISIFNKFYTTAIVGVILIPIELFMHLWARRSLIQSAFVLLLIAFALDTLVSTIAFYRQDNIFFDYLAQSIELDRFSLLLLANEMLASILAILAGILFLVICKPIPIRLKLIDP